MMRQTLILIASVFAFATAYAAGANAQSSREEFGKCGYYADALHGRKTTSGEKYDKTLLTCAHKTLPFGTSIRVTRLDNGKSVVVRVNDRGPFIDGYVVDLSRKAAESIGLIRDGVTRVKIDILGKSTASAIKPASYTTTTKTKTVPKALEPAQKASTVRYASSAKAQLVKPQGSKTPTPATYSAPAKAKPQSVPAKAKKNAPAVSELYQIQLNPVRGQGYGLQLAVLSSSENLFQQINRLQASWPGKVIISHEEAYGVATYKLILGPYLTRKEALAQQRKATSKGYKKSFVVGFE